MSLLQVHQAKALRDLHEGGHDPEVLSELHTTTDLALRVTKVTARSLGRAMSTMVVQERHLWLCLADMKEADKARFLNAPMSQTSLFGDAVENFAQQFSAAQKQTEAIGHILGWGWLLFGRWWTHHSLPRRRAGRRILCFFFFRHWPHGQWYPKPQQKSSFLYLWVPTGDGGLWTSQSWVTLTLLSRQWAAVGGSYCGTHAPSAGTQVSASHTPTPLRTGNETPEPGPCVPPRCPTVGTSVGSLLPLVRFLGAWLALPNPSRWLRHTLNSAMRFSSPGDLPSIAASTLLQWRQGMPPSCEQRSQSYWRRTR